jgi:hypothetical protein
MVISMSLMPQKLLGKKHVYELKVLPSYERNLDPKGIQTLEGMNSQRK